MKNNSSANIASTASVQWIPSAKTKKLIEREAKKRGMGYNEAARVLSNECLAKFANPSPKSQVKPARTHGRPTREQLEREKAADRFLDQMDINRITVKVSPETMADIRAEAERLGCSVQQVVDHNCPSILKVWLPQLFELDRARAEHRMPRESSLTV